MSAFKTTGLRAGLQNQFGSGDTLLLPTLVATDATAAGITIPASKMITGLFRRSGPGAGYTDTFDTAVNIYNALVGEGSDPEIAVGDAFLLRIINSVAFLETITLGAGMVAGVGTIASVTASTWREFLFTFLSVQKPISIYCNTTNGSAAVTFVLAPNQTALPMGPAPGSANITPGAFVSGTGIAAGTTVLGLTQAPGGMTGFTLSANATATGTALLSFGPYLKVDGPGSGTL